MVDAARARRLAERIQVVVAETLEMRVKDPRQGSITITDVRVTGDVGVRRCRHSDAPHGEFLVSLAR